MIAGPRAFDNNRKVVESGKKYRANFSMKANYIDLVDYGLIVVPGLIMNAY
jgi:hypothetical protein